MVTITMFQNNERNGILLYQGECRDRRYFEYDEIHTKAHTIIQLLDDGLIMNRKDEDHTTLLHLLNTNAYSVVESEYGQLRFDAQLLKFQRNEDYILVRYRLTETFTIIFDFRS